MKILLIEDEPSLAKAFVRILKHRGHVVQHVLGIQEALELVRDDPPEVVLTDRQVVGGDGWTIRLHVNSQLTRVVLMTAQPPSEPPPAFFRKGIDPVSKLLEMIETP